MTITELVLRNDGGELQRVELRETDNFIDLHEQMDGNPDLRLMLRCLSAGDTISVEERWTESV